MTIEDQTSAITAPVARKVRKGFLPIATNTFDRCFISVVIFIAVSLLWFRFVEPQGFSIWIAVAISAVVGFLIVTRG